MASRRASLFVLAVLSCCCLGFGPPVLTDGDIPRRTISPQQLRLLAQPAPPHVEAAAAMLVNPTSGQILYAKNEHERRAPASLVKIVTALVALQRGRLDQEIEVAPGDLAPLSAAGLRAGERHNLQQMLYVVLVLSDNAAATAIARNVGGDVATFVGAMNDLAAGWGLADTRFANPHGLDDEQGYSSAYDMAVIARLAMMDETFASMVGRYEVAAADRVLQSTNELLNSYPGAIGVKTGTTGQAGECLIAMVERPTGRALSVVMGSSDRYADSRILLDYFYAGYAELRIDLPASSQNRYRDAEGQWHAFGLEEPLTLLIQPWQVGTASLYRRIDDPRPDPDSRAPIGALEVRLAGRRIAELPLYVR